MTGCGPHRWLVVAAWLVACCGCLSACSDAGPRSPDPSRVAQAGSQGPALYHGLAKLLGPGEPLPSGPMQDALVRGSWCLPQAPQPLLRLLPGPAPHIVRLVQQVQPGRQSDAIGLAVAVTGQAPELEVLQVDLTTGTVTRELNGPLVAMETTTAGLAFVTQLAEPPTATTLASLAEAAPKAVANALASLTKPPKPRPVAVNKVNGPALNNKRAALAALRTLLPPEPPPPPLQALSLVGKQGVVRVMTRRDQHVLSLAVSPDQGWLLYAAVPAKTRHEAQPATLWRVALPEGVPVELPGEVSRVWAVVQGGRSALARAMYDGGPQTVLVDLASGQARVIGPDAEAILVLGESALLQVADGSLIPVSWEGVALAEPPTGTVICPAGGLPALVQSLPTAGVAGCASLLLLQWWDGESLTRAAQWCQQAVPGGPPPALFGVTAAMPLRATPDLSVLLAILTADSNYNGQLEPGLDTGQLCLFPRSVEPLPAL